MSNLTKFTLVLFLVNFAASGVLAGVYYATKPVIESRKTMAEEEALKEVMPQSAGERMEAVEKDGVVRYWKVFEGAGYKPAGYIFIAKKYGYAGVVETMAGMKSDGTITGVRVLSQNETPGLGAKMVETVSDVTILKALGSLFSRDKEKKKNPLPYFTGQFNGLNVKKIELSRDSIHAITGATISSRAVLDSVKSKGLDILAE